MDSAQGNLFMEAIGLFKPQTQLLSYFNLFAAGKAQLANSLSPLFYKIALDARLLGCFKMITTKVHAYCDRFAKSQLRQLQEPMKELEMQYFGEVNVLKRQIQDTKQQVTELAELYLRIAQIDIKYAQYYQALDFVQKAKQLNVLPPQTYLPLQMKCLLLSGQIGRAITCRMPLLDKKVQLKPQMVEFYIGQGLGQVYEGRTNFFRQLINMNPQPSQLVSDYASPGALGDFYSLLVVANGDRTQMKKDLKFSSKFQNLYLEHKYAQYLDRANQVLLSYVHDPFVGHRTTQIRQRIKCVVLFQVLSAYKVVKLQTVIQLLDYTEAEIKKMLCENRRLNSGSSQYQIDPVQRDIVLMQEANRIAQLVEQINKNLNARQETLLERQMAKAQYKQNPKKHYDYSKKAR